MALFLWVLKIGFAVAAFHLPLWIGAYKLGRFSFLDIALPFVAVFSWALFSYLEIGSVQTLANLVEILLAAGFSFIGYSLKLVFVRRSSLRVSAVMTGLVVLAVFVMRLLMPSLPE